MDIKGLVEAVKEFAWDLFGYFIPGFILMFSVSVFSSKSIYLSVPTEFLNEDIFFLLVMVMSFSLGYVVYGVSLLVDSLTGTKKSIREKIEELEAFKTSKELYLQDLKQKGINSPNESIGVSELRNYVMSYFPENDRKVYSFMFRSDLSNHLASICLIISFVGIVSFIFSLMNFNFAFKPDWPYTFYYVFLLIPIYPLFKTKYRFYEIAMKIPFSMFNSNHRK